ncbi:hypothetical protein A8B78_00735 [Jannaschia sp. EhC01]|nr:hypothetical protein A8B78_00735 [Jannaschia sp. EhC01]
MALCRRKLFVAGFVVSDEVEELNELLFELDILGCHGLFPRIDAYRVRLFDVHAMAIQSSADDLDDTVSVELASLGRMHANIIAAMVIDLKFTPKLFWQRGAYDKQLEELSRLNGQSA